MPVMHGGVCSHLAAAPAEPGGLGVAGVFGDLRDGLCGQFQIRMEADESWPVVLLSLGVLMFRRVGRSGAAWPGRYSALGKRPGSATPGIGLARAADRAAGLLGLGSPWCGWLACGDA